jgi:hypothetical protein
MKIIDPVTITDAMLTSTNVLENDHATWNSGTTYAAGDRCISTVTHKIYQSVGAGNLNNDPTLVINADLWLLVSATNRWKAFDNRIVDQTVKAGSITYRLTPGTFCTAMAFFGLLGEHVRIQVTDSIDGATYDQTFTLLDTGHVIDYLTYCFSPPRQLTRLVVENIPLYDTGYVDISIASATESRVGEIVLGPQSNIGESLVGSRLGIIDYSLKTVDDFGNTTLQQRAFADTVTFEVAFPTVDAERIKSLLSSLRARGAVYHDGEGFTNIGTLVFGWPKQFGVDLVSQNTSFGSIEIEGLI